MYLIGFSGPPRSGKDSIGGMLAAMIEDRFGIQPQVLSLSTPMRAAIFAMSGMEYSELTYESLKDSPLDIFNGRTIRQEMIDLSERHVKPRLGQGFWGRAVIQRVWPEARVVIITDMGFNAERDVFEQEYGAESCAFVQVAREGTDFSKDSRSYIYSTIKQNDYPLLNNAHIRDGAAAILSQLTNRLGWF